MRFDTNTNGHMQWYYFSVKNAKKCKVKFNIFRFRKPYSLYQRGFRPYSLSRKRGGSWVPTGENVKYLKQTIVNQNGVKKTSGFYFLSFNYTFQHENDQVFFAACIPYTTTYLSSRINLFLNQFASQTISFQKIPLCNTLCGQEIEYLSIEPIQDPHRPRPRQFIVINSRSHPGETSSSWVTDGLIQSLLSDPLMHSWMIETNVCFRIVPMLNKDGVFIGNYRTGIVGDDFNRRFYSGQRQFFPQISALKKLINKCEKLGTVRLFLDIHGHSILKNSFIFGPDRKTFIKQPLLNIGQFLFNNSKYFSRTSCNYKNQKNKIQTARVYFQMQENLPSLTCQNSLGLYYDNYQTFQFTQQDWQAFGKHILHSLRLTFENVPQIPSGIQSVRSKPNKQKQLLNTLKPPDRKITLMSNPISNAQIPRKASVGIKKTLPLTKYNQKRPSLNRQKNTTTITPSPWRQSKEKRSFKRQRTQKQLELSDKKLDLQGSMILSRYGQSKSLYQQSSEARVSRTAKIQSQSITKQPMIQLIGEQQIIPENFSEDYVSMNDSDPEEDDIDPQKRMQLFKCIQDINKQSNIEQADNNMTPKEYLVPVKGFKEYKLSFQRDQSGLFQQKKQQQGSKLKPLKFQQFRMRGMTQKKIKGNMELILQNSSLTSDRQTAKILRSKNEEMQRNTRNKKKQKIMMEIFPHMQQQQYLLMRIKEMTLNSSNQKD